MSAGQAFDFVMPIERDSGIQNTLKPYAMPMQRWMAKAAGGTSQRLNPGCAIIRSRSSSPVPGGMPAALPTLAIVVFSQIAFFIFSSLTIAATFLVSQLFADARKSRFAELFGGPDLSREWAHACSAVFELGNLPEGVEHRVGERVGRALVEAERHEDHAVGDLAVRPQNGLDTAAPGFDLNHVADRQAPARDFVRVHGRDALRLDGIEHAGAPGHRPGMPMLEHATGRQDQ